MSLISTRHTTTMIGPATPLPVLPGTLEIGDLYLFDNQDGGAYVSDDGAGNLIWRLLGSASDFGTTFSTQIVPGTSSESTETHVWFLANDAQIPIDRHDTPVDALQFPVVAPMTKVKVKVFCSVNTLNDPHIVDIHLYKNGVDQGSLFSFAAGVTGLATATATEMYSATDRIDIGALASLSDGEGFIVSATIQPSI
jgi:hypothetical protein